MVTEGSGPWADFDAEAERWGVDCHVTRGELAAMVERSIFELPAAGHLRLHQDARDLARWGRRGGPTELEAPINHREALR